MNWLFKPTDIASLAFFRVCFGILAFADVMGLLTYYHWYKGAYDPEEFHFKYYGFEWVNPLPEPLMSFFLISLLGAAILVALGKWYRVSATYFALGFTYMFLVEKGHYLNHGYLFCVLSYLMILFPAHRAYSWDVLTQADLRRETVPYYPLFLLKFAMGTVYFMGGIAKLNPDWLNAMPLKLWLGYKKDYFLIGPILEQEWTAWAMSYGGVFLDLCIVPLLLFRKTRVFGLCLILFFHVINTMVFQIGIFPWLSICLSLLYFEPSFPRKVGKWLQKKHTIFTKIENWWEKKIKQAHPTHTGNLSNPISYSFSKKRIITVLIACFCTLNLLIPLRHHYFKGDVAWTEEGHRYSWRMMLRSKRGRGYFEVRNLQADSVIKVRPRDVMLEKLAPKTFTHPDMILQFAHHLRDDYRTQWQTDSVAVHAYIRCRLNGGKYQTYINPKVDLAKENWSFLKASDWIIPLEDKNRRK